MKAEEDELRDPIERLAAWCDRAQRTGDRLHDAVCLATCSAEGRPSARMVLFKGVDRGRLLFYTDYRSRKARELDGNPHAALVFHWKALGRQIRVEGEVEKLDPTLSDAYFLSRSRGSRISAWTSHQSAPVEGRAQLVRQREEIVTRFAGREVTRPEHWGGYGLDARSIEFWSERPDRFHERLLFLKTDGGWDTVRLQP